MNHYYPSTYKTIFNQKQKEQRYELLKYIVNSIYDMFDYSSKNIFNDYKFKQVFFKEDNENRLIDIWFLFENKKTGKLDIHNLEENIMDETMKKTLKEIQNLFRGTDTDYIHLTFFEHLDKNPKAKLLTDTPKREEELRAFLGEEFLIQYEKDKLNSILNKTINTENSNTFKNKQKL
jgi:hypothetical protein